MITTILCGLEEEANLLPKRDDIQVLFGTARENLDKMVARGCDQILSFGVSGGLNPKLNIGDLVIADAVVNAKETYKSWASINNYWMARFPHSQMITEYCSGNEEASTAEERLALFNTYKADAIDDESIRVARFAIVHGIPWGVIRAISDNAKTFLPAWMLQATDAHGKSSFKAILEGLGHHPTEVIDLVEVGYNFERALHTLKIVSNELF